MVAKSCFGGVNASRGATIGVSSPPDSPRAVASLFSFGSSEVANPAASTMVGPVSFLSSLSSVVDDPDVALVLAFFVAPFASSVVDDLDVTLALAPFVEPFESSVVDDLDVALVLAFLGRMIPVGGAR